MVLGGLKLIYRLSDNYYELYDLEADPTERQNIVDDHPGRRLESDVGTVCRPSPVRLGAGKTGAQRPPGSPR